jgi:carboxylate-amine ligase
VVATVNRSLVCDGRSAARSARAPTLGVEEEFTLLDPRTGAVVPRAAEVIRNCQDAAGVVAESMTYMVETRTPVCRTLRDVQRSLRTKRRTVADVARGHGALVVASGLAPFGLPDPAAVTNKPRYRELLRRFPRAMSTNGTCGCHVHVAVPTRQLGVEALLRLRRWLPALVALTANSPIWQGRDTGWASQRLVFTSRWPTAVPAPPVWSADEYDHLLEAAVSAGDALDTRSVYFLARLSPRYPTVEVRVADVSLTADETLCYAGLVRALVTTAVDEALRCRPVAFVLQAALRESCRSAAHAGLAGTLVDPQTGDRVESWQLVDELVEHVRPRLRAHGDEALVVPVLDRLRVVGGGADRQRQLFTAASSPTDFVTALAETTTTDLRWVGARPAHLVTGSAVATAPTRSVRSNRRTAGTAVAAAPASISTNAQMTTASRTPTAAANGPARTCPTGMATSDPSAS